MPLHTRYVPPRFLVPVCPRKRERDNKRPIVAYTDVLNGLTDIEWAKLKLPPVSTCVTKPIAQLSDLECGRSALVLSVASEDCGGGEHVPVARDVPEVASGDVNSRYEIGDPDQRLCHPECVPGLGGEAVCLWDDECDDLTNANDENQFYNGIVSS